MKKSYTKPELFCEEYELSASIAGNCDMELHLHDVNTTDYKSCGIHMGFDWIFISDPNCDTLPEGDGDYGICYQQPYAGSKVFSS